MIAEMKISGKTLSERTLSRGSLALKKEAIENKTSRCPSGSLEKNHSIDSHGLMVMRFRISD